MKNKAYIYRAFERFWHWTQAFLIFLLAATGFEVHGTLHFFGYQNAVKYHKVTAYTFLVLIAFAIFWHLTTGEWRQYLPTAKNLKSQLNFYLFGIFKNAPHPTKKTVLSKLNPLQKLVYLGLKILVIPVMAISGLLYMYYRYPQENGIGTLTIHSLAPIAIIHTAGAFLLVAFIIAHLYLITTGTTVTSNLKAMISGYEDLDVQPKVESIQKEEIAKKEEVLEEA